jgi:DNA-binding CsgD family transcriptional regulator
MESRLELLTLTDGAAAQRGFNAWRVDDLETSRLSLEALLDVASSRGETVSANFMVTHLAVVAAMEGRLADASRYLDSFGAADPWISDPVPIFVFASAIRHIASEDDESLESILSGTGPRSGATSRLVRAAVRGIRAARHERWDEALPYLSDAHRTARSQGILEPGRRYWLDIELGETQVGVGDLAGAEETRLRLQRLADQGDRPLMDGVSSRLGGLLHAARGDLDMAEVAFESSIRTLNASPFQIEAARSCLEMGRLLRRTRRRVPARAMLSATLATVTEMGDRPLARRISRELDLVPASRSDTILTPTERRIVDSAASGMSNRQIAAAHLIGVRTVETHLTTIYRKTGVPSRSGLSVWIQAQND